MEIQLKPVATEALEGIDDFSHPEIIYFFDKVKAREIVFSGRTGGNPNYPVAGIFAQRKKDRPNRMGLCTVELLKHKGRTRTVIISILTNIVN